MLGGWLKEIVLKAGESEAVSKVSSSRLNTYSISILQYHREWSRPTARIHIVLVEVRPYHRGGATTDPSAFSLQHTVIIW